MNSSTGWDLRIDPSVFKTLKKIPKRDAKNLLAVIRILPEDPYYGDVQKMKGEEGAWRRRSGAYRIFYSIKVLNKIILVFKLERRTSKTY